MHNKRIFHRDLKPENIIVDAKLFIKIIDFGFAEIQKNKKLNTFRGTRNYMAPEIFKGEKYNGS